jgi:amidase
VSSGAQDGSLAVFSPGQTLAGRYTGLGPLGQGGMGIVLAAYDARGRPGAQARSGMLAAMDPRELVFWPAHRMAAAVRAREVSSGELVEAHLTWIARRNPALNAVVILDEAGARARAREADAALAAGVSWGPLHGVPITIKDIYDVAGMRTTYGYKPTRLHVASRHATVVQRLLDAGAVLLGKTNIPEISFDWQCLSPIFGRTVNPWDPTRSPGGSSGGSAAAVAAGLSPLDIGSDSAGSLRIPAHYCGIYTLRPTENRIPTTGHGELPGMLRAVRHISTCGPLTRSVEDLSLALSLLEGPDGRAWEVPPPPPMGPVPGSLSECRFAYSEELGVPVSEEVKAVLRDTVARLERAGARVERCTPPDFDMDSALRAWGWLMGTETGADAELLSIARLVDAVLPGFQRPPEA